MRPKTTEVRILQEKYYRDLKRKGFKDIEYGKEHQPRLYEPVNFHRISESQMTYYDLVWKIYHIWVDEGRSKRDLLICELLALQEGDTGTLRGIAKVLRKRRMRRASKQYVQFTLNEINLEIKIQVQILEKIIPPAQD